MSLLLKWYPIVSGNTLRDIKHLLIFPNYTCEYLVFAGIEPWTFEQAYGEAVFIPAGCPHQVRNLKVGSLL